MGYINDVVLAIAPEATESFYALLSTDDSLFSMVRAGSDNFSTSRFRKGDLLIEWYEVKWHSGFSEVNKIEKWLESQPIENYRFMRVGEDKNDTYEHGEYAWEYLEISNPQIELDFPEEVED